MNTLATGSRCETAPRFQREAQRQKATTDAFSLSQYKRYFSVASLSMTSFQNYRFAYFFLKIGYLKNLHMLM